MIGKGLVVFEQKQRGFQERGVEWPKPCSASLHLHNSSAQAAVDGFNPPAVAS